MFPRVTPHPGGAVVEWPHCVLKPCSTFMPAAVAPDGREVPFSSAKSETGDYKTGVGEGFYTRLTDFPGLGGLALELRVWAEYETGDVRFDLIPLQDAPVSEILWPAPMEMDAPDGYAVLPFMQGCLLKNGGQGAGRFDGKQLPCSRGMTMRFFAQYDHAGGYVMIADSPFDTGLMIDAKPDSAVRVSLRHMASLGAIRYDRHCRIKPLRAGQDYNDAAAIYREYIRQDGALVTLREKIARNPRVADYIATPICHTKSRIHIVPESSYYTPGRDDLNDTLTTFDEVGEKLRRLKALGVDRLCLHLDGWQRRGYDNLHPDALPPCEEAGGWAGFRRLKDTCHSLGYFFGVHDQYRDYYYDCDSFDLENAARGVNGQYEDISTWYGGRQTVLCGKVAVDYVRRNYGQMEREGALPDNAYLDVFSVVELDECANPAHVMDRRACAAARAKCFSLVGAKGIVVQSEELVDWALPYIDFIHHAPFALDQTWDRGHAIGAAIPLEYLVYHDCLIMPFFPRRGGFGVDQDVDGGLLSLLYGAGTYVMDDSDDKDIERLHKIIAWQKKTQLEPMLRHTFLSPTRQECVFAGGHVSRVDFETGDVQLEG